ncbi:SxtJ family membrane protein [Mucilaginibacter sp. CSA2-8R]|uniref:SxtJ family membrane protein n=1 Tax=Mucilaginibacter sp. CSA2-8R TaxID=3141542 RepID=UPI00315D3214
MKAPLKENRDLGLLVGAAFMVIALYKWHKHSLAMPWFAAISGVLIFSALIVPQWLTWPRKGWEALGKALGYINTLVLLTLVYVVIVTPFGLISRLLGNDPLKLKTGPTADNYWKMIDNDQTQLEQQF